MRLPFNCFDQKIKILVVLGRDKQRFKVIFDYRPISLRQAVLNDAFD
jgi:hypothetical protein